MDQVINTFVRVKTLNKETSANIEDENEEEEFLQQFGFLSQRKSPDVDNEGEEKEENTLSDRLRKIERPKSFDVKKSFTDDVCVLY